ncbi:TlpA disulfide reductase family protein [Pedobacter duraquae]|uniref:Peroxiredoxin n=1 Tax=Pedobacter duraquae TaxID=425511 RepID=A0A4R6IBH2_9SPHI|nr:TlpA disulfide reductase family protein [Pedobacter duraquae]TDO19553.1 peroxiredoxin [Pedobacter duraquae]
MKNLILVLVFLMPLHNYAQKVAATTFTIQVDGRKMLDKPTLYLFYQQDGKKYIDSANQKNGIYLFKGEVDHLINVAMAADHTRTGLQNLLKKKTYEVDVLKFYIYPGLIGCKTDSLLSSVTFTNSVVNRDLQRLDILSRPNAIKTTELEKKLVVAKDKTEKDILQRSIDSLLVARRAMWKSFYQKNPSSEAALIALKWYAGPEASIADYGPIFMRLSKQVRNTPEGKSFYKQLLDKGTLVAGSRAPDFEQADTQGKMVRLSSFNGKYVLLDFWASWCGPCRKENPALVKVYQEFKDKKFTILGVSLDEHDGRAAWLEAIKKDGLIWPQVSDLKHWDNAVAKLYSISSIPQSFLIGPDGVIIARDLNAEQLKLKLIEVMSIKE